MTKRKALVDGLKQSLEAAKTPEEKRKALEAFRAQSEALLAERQKSLPSEARPAKLSTQAVAEMKSKAQGNPERKQQVARLEAKLAEVEKIKAKLKSIQDAPPEQRPQLIEEFRKEREEIAQKNLQEAKSAEANQKPVDRSTALKNMPPEMQAMMAKQEQRRREVEALKESLKTAGAEERQKLVQAWRQKQQTDMAQRQQAVRPQGKTTTP